MWGHGSLLAGTSTGVGGMLGVLFRPGERSLVLRLGFSSGIMLGMTFLRLVLESLEAGFFLAFIGITIGGRSKEYTHIIISLWRYYKYETYSCRDYSR